MRGASARGRRTSVEPSMSCEAARRSGERQRPVQQLDGVGVALEASFRERARHHRSSAPSAAKPGPSAIISAPLARHRAAGRSISSSTKSTSPRTCCRSAAARRASGRPARSSSSSSRARRSITRRPAECSTQWRDVLALEPLRVHEARRHLPHHGGADAPDVLGQDRRAGGRRDTRSPWRQVLGAEERCGARRWPAPRRRRSPRAPPRRRRRWRGPPRSRAGRRGSRPPSRSRRRRPRRGVRGKRGGDSTACWSATMALAQPVSPTCTRWTSGLQPEPRDQVRVEARAEASGARGGGDEVDVGRLPAGALEARRTRRAPSSRAPRRKRSFSSSTLSSGVNVSGSM